MPVYVQCPQCDRKLGVPENLLGKRVKCPSCQTVFTAEEPGGAAAPPPPPAEEERVAPREPPSSRRRDDNDRDRDDDRDEDRPRRRREGGGREKASQMVQAPAIALLVYGILSILATLASLVYAIVQAMSLRGPDKDAAPVLIAVNGCFTVLFLILSVFIILGGVKMRALQGYGLAMTGSIMAMLILPCCCVPGIGLGIWALIVLNNPDVKAAFR